MAITHLSGTVVGMSEGKPKATLILGAGWSYAAGLPLTKDLFKANPVVASLASKNRLKQVAGAYDRWATDTRPQTGSSSYRTFTKMGRFRGLGSSNTSPGC